MLIPEYPRGYCVQMMKKGLYDDILDYLETCDFYIIRFVSQVEFLPNKENSYKVWHGLAANFNDCFDCCWKAPEIFDQFITEKSAKFANKEWRKKTCVACFTEYCNRFNPKMWYMYANKYSGACLVYSISSIAKAINQCYKTISKDEKELLEAMFFAPVFYASKNEAISEKMDKCDLRKVLFEKNNCWSDELEWRNCFFLKNIRDTGLNLISCKPDQIIFGAEMSEDDKKKIVKKYKKSGIKFYQSILNYKTLKMEEGLVVKKDLFRT